MKAKKEGKEKKSEEDIIGIEESLQDEPRDKETIEAINRYIG